MDRLVLTLIKKKKGRKEVERKDVGEGERERGGEKVSRNVEAKIALSR